MSVWGAIKLRSDAVAASAAVWTHHTHLPDRPNQLLADSVWHNKLKRCMFIFCCGCGPSHTVCCHSSLAGGSDPNETDLIISVISFIRNGAANPQFTKYISKIMKISVAAPSEQIRVIKWSKLMQFPFGKSWIIEDCCGKMGRRSVFSWKATRTDGWRTDGRCASRVASLVSEIIFLKIISLSYRNVFSFIFIWFFATLHSADGFFMKIGKNSEFHEAKMSVGERKNRKCSVVKIEKCMKCKCEN